MANKWNQQEQGAKRRRSNQGTRGTARTKPAASNPNKNTKSTDTNRNSGRTAAAKPAPKAAPKAAPKQTKPKQTTVQKAKQSVTYYTNKNKGNTATQAANRLVRQKATAQVLTGKQTPLPPNRATRMGQTLNPMEQLKTDAKLGPRYWTSRATVPSKPLTAEQQKKKNQQTAKQSGFNARARKQTLSSYDQKLTQGKRFQIQQAKQRFDEAKAKGDRAGMEKAHREAESLRLGSGYSGGAFGNEYITANLTQDEYNRLNADGQKAMKQARLTRSRAVTEDEIARADRRIEEILNAPGYQNRGRDINTARGMRETAEGRSTMLGATREQREQDAAGLKNATLAGLHLGAGGAGHWLEATDWTIANRNRDQNMAKWLQDADDYESARSDLEYYDNYVQTFGEPPAGMNRNVLQMRLNNATQAKAQLERMQTDPHSAYYDETVAQRLGMPTDTQSYWEKMIRQGQQEQLASQEGLSPAEKWINDLYISGIQTIPTTAAALIPGGQGGALAGLASAARGLALAGMGASAAGNRMTELQDAWYAFDKAYRDATISGIIEAGTEMIGVEKLASAAAGKVPQNALRAILEQGLAEGGEEALSYALNTGYNKLADLPGQEWSWKDFASQAAGGAVMGAVHMGAGIMINSLAASGAVSQERAQRNYQVWQASADQARSLLNDAKQWYAMMDQGAVSQEEAEAALSQVSQQINGQAEPVTREWLARQEELLDIEENAIRGAITRQEARDQQSQILDQVTAQNRDSEANRMAAEWDEEERQTRAAQNAAVSARTRLDQRLEDWRWRQDEPISTSSYEEAVQKGQEALRATDAEMARRDAVAQLQAETPPITYERSGLPPTSFLGAAIDARREARARAEAEAQVRRDQEVARQNRAAAEQQTISANEPAEIGTSVLQNEQVQTQQPVSRLEGLASTFGESGAASLRTIGGKMVTGQGAFVRDFTDVYNQVLGGRSESQVSRPAGMSDANYFAAVTAAENDRQTGWDLDILKASKAAGRNVNAGVDWRDQYVRQMDRKTARTVDGLAKALGVKVVFAEQGSILTAGGARANAEITGNVVRIEKDNPNPVRMLIGHELTHRMQDVSPDTYRAFRDYAMSVPGSMEALERTVSLYQRAGAFRAQDNARQMAMDEVTADFAGSLLENSEQLQEFIRRNYENRTMLEVIRDFFRDLAAKLTGRQKAQADDAVRLLEEAIKGASERVKKSGKAEKGNKNTVREGGVKKLFSLSSPVEETKTLVALHNLDAEKIDRSLRLGAFPAPSIAVVKAKEGHSKFGPISIVFPRSTIDPEASRKNRVYGSDAWTPTHSNARVEYPVNYDALLRIEKQLEELSGQVAGGTFRGNSLLRRRGLDDDSSMDRKELAERLSGDDEVRAAYLAAQGRTLEPVMREKEFDAMGNDFLQTILDTVGEQEIAGMTATLMEGGRLTEADKGTLREIWRQNWIKSLPKRIREKRSPEFIEEKSHNRAAELSDFKMEQFVRHTWDYYENHGVKGDEIDRIATSDKLRAAVNDADVTAWMEDQLDGLLGEPGVYNGKEPHTASGNKRSFATLHYPYTAEGIVRAMFESTTGSRGQNAWGVNANTLISVATPEYGSVDEIHADEDRLRQLPEEEYKALLAPIDAEITSFIQGVKKTNKAFAASDYEEGEIIASILMDNAGKKTAKAIQSGFRKEGYTLSPELAKSALDIFKQARAVPTGYFEAKPERVVGFDEVLAAVVPSDMDAGLRSRMEDAGMRLIDYERDNEQSRMDAVNSVEGARFSITPQADADYMAAVESGDMETAQRMVDEAAKAAGYNVKVYHGTTQEMQSASRGRLTGKEYDQLEKDYADKLFPFVVFKSGIAHAGIYTATDRGVAEDFMFSFSHGGTVFDLYAKTKNPLVVDAGGKGWNNIPLDAADAVGLTQEVLSGLDSYQKTRNKNNIYIDDLVEYAKKRGHDGVVVENVRETGFGDEDSPITTDVIVFDPNQVKSADPVTYDDNGDVIPLSERFNAETGDIRYSIGTEGYDRARLMRENQQLKEKLDYWRGQVKKSDRTKADPKEVRKLAKILRADYSTDMDAGEITQRLQAIYDGIGKDWTYDRAYEEAGKLARDMIEQATATEDYLYNENEPLRKFFKDTALVVTPEIKRAIPDYNEWRKAQFGKLRLQSGDQTNIDQVFQEAAALWPEWFSEEVSANSLDQLDRIVEVLDNVYRREEINPFEDDIAGPAGYLTTQIMDSFWDVPSIKKTFADRAEARLGREVTRRLDMKERYENALQKVREQRDRKLREQSQRYLTAKRKNSQKQKERELRAKIVRHVNKLSTKLTRPTDTQHIPEDLIPTVRTALESINLASKDMKDTKRTQAFEALRKMYQEMDTNGSEVVIDPDLLPNISDIIGFADTPIANLGLEDLNTIWQTVRAIEASISTFNKALGRAKFETISQPAFGIRDYLTGRKDRGDYRGPFRQMDKLLNFNMLTPEAYFLRMGNSGKEVFRMLRDAQDRHITIMDQAQRKTREIIGKTDIRKLEKEKHTFTFDGETVELTTAQIMSLHELMKRQQAVDHVMIGGVRPESVKNGIKDLPPARPWHLTQDQVSEAVDSLAPEQVKLADELQKYMGGTMAELGNEASMEVYGYRKFTEKHYFPISVDKNQTQSDVKNDAVSGTIAGWGSARPVKPNANNAVILRSIFDVYADHVTEMANYASWLAPMENMNRIFNFRYKDAEGNQTGTMKAQLETLFGKNGEAYWRQLQADLNNGVHGRDDSPFSALMGTYKASAIGANIRVIAQQPTAILRALDSINPADFVAGMARARWGKFDNVVKQYAPIAIWKDWGYFQQDTGRQMRNVLFNDDTKLQKANSAMMWGAGKADSISWTAIWNALESETRRKRKDLRYKSREFYEAVAERFNEVVDHTQVVDGILQRSQIMRSADGLTKMATSFMAEPTKTYNMMLSAIYEARNAKGRERSAAMGKLAKTAFALTVSITVNAAAQSLVDAIRDDDKDEDYWEKFIQAYFGLEGDTRKEQIKNGILNGNLEAAFNPLTYIPYLKDIVSQTQGYSVSRMDMDTISRVLKAFTNVEKAMSGEGKNTKQSAWLNLTVEVARFLGVSAANVKRDVQTILRTFFAGTGNYRMLYAQEKFLYDVTSKNTLTEFSKLILGAERAGDEEAAQAIRQDMIDSGVDAEKIDKKLAELRKKAVTDTEEFQTELAQKTDAYNTMLEASDQFQALTEDQQTKARGMVEDYAEWQSYGDQVALGEKDQAAYDKIQEAEAHDIPATDWIVFTTAASELKADYKEDGTRIDGSKKEKVLKLIDSYDIPNEGKSYMYLSQGYSEKDNPYQ